MFTVNNHGIFQTNYVVQGMNTGAKHQYESFMYMKGYLLL